MHDKRASDDLRLIIDGWFGSLDLRHPTKFLFSRGYITIGSIWSKPTPNHHMCYEEFVCLSFLVNEHGDSFNFPDTKPPEPVERTIERWFGRGRARQLLRPVAFLMSRGYSPGNGVLLWFKPANYHNVSYEESVCLAFLSKAIGARLITFDKLL